MLVVSAINFNWAMIMMIMISLCPISQSFLFDVDSWKVITFYYIWSWYIFIMFFCPITVLFVSLCKFSGYLKQVP